METRTFLAFVAGGLVLLALGRGISQERDTRQAGMAPLGLAIQAAGLGLITFAVYRLVRGMA